MEIITVNADNLEREHICCAMSDKKGNCGASAKKEWMRERFGEGLVFKKMDVRGKAFIEYIPAEKAWCPIIAEGYLYINCFWVAGQLKGNGYANRLLEACIGDAREKGRHGLVVLSSAKKAPYLSEPGYLRHKGFLVADSAAPHYQLFYLPFTKDAPVPRFKDCVKRGGIEEMGMVLYYSNQCPYTEKYVPMLRQAAARHGLTVTIHKLETAEEAQEAPAPFTTFSFFYDGKFVTNRIFDEKAFERFLEEQVLLN